MTSAEKAYNSPRSAEWGPASSAKREIVTAGALWPTRAKTLFEGLRFSQ